MKQIWWSGILVVLIVILHQAFLLSAFLSNLAWLELAKAKHPSVSQKERVIKALNTFQRAIMFDTSNRRTFIGAGMANTTLGDEVAALTNWKTAQVDPWGLISLGDRKRAKANWNEALAYYKSAAGLSHLHPNSGWLLAGRVCQFTFANPDILSPANQTFCHDYFAQNGGNLIVNSRFDDGNLWGWYERYWSGFSGEYRVDHETKNFAPTALIVGVVDNQVGALSQRVALPPGTIIHYSAWIKIQGGNKMTGRLLHIVWQQKDGKSRGNQLDIISEDMDWTYLERTFQAGEAKDSIFIFSPILLSGQGTAWIDDVQLKVIVER